MALITVNGIVPNTARVTGTAEFDDIRIDFTRQGSFNSLNLQPNGGSDVIFVELGSLPSAKFARKLAAFEARVEAGKSATLSYLGQKLTIQKQSQPGDLRFTVGGVDYSPFSNSLTGTSTNAQPANQVIALTSGLDNLAQTSRGVTFKAVVASQDTASTLQGGDKLSANLSLLNDQLSVAWQKDFGTGLAQATGIDILSLQRDLVPSASGADLVFNAAGLANLRKVVIDGRQGSTGDLEPATAGERVMQVRGLELPPAAAGKAPFEVSLNNLKASLDVSNGVTTRTTEKVVLGFTEASVRDASDALTVLLANVRDTRLQVAGIESLKISSDVSPLNLAGLPNSLSLGEVTGLETLTLVGRNALTLSDLPGSLSVVDATLADGAQTLDLTTGSPSSGLQLRGGKSTVDTLIVKQVSGQTILPFSATGFERLSVSPTSSSLEIDKLMLPDLREVTLSGSVDGRVVSLRGEYSNVSFVLETPNNQVGDTLLTDQTGLFSLTTRPQAIDNFRDYTINRVAAINAETVNIGIARGSTLTINDLVFDKAKALNIATGAGSLTPIATSDDRSTLVVRNSESLNTLRVSVDQQGLVLKPITLSDNVTPDAFRGVTDVLVTGAALLTNASGSPVGPVVGLDDASMQRASVALGSLGSDQANVMLDFSGYTGSVSARIFAQSLTASTARVESTILDVVGANQITLQGGTGTDVITVRTSGVVTGTVDLGAAKPDQMLRFLVDTDAGNLDLSGLSVSGVATPFVISSAVSSNITGSSAPDLIFVTNMVNSLTLGAGSETLIFDGSVRMNADGDSLQDISITPGQAAGLFTPATPDVINASGALRISGMGSGDKLLFSGALGELALNLRPEVLTGAANSALVRGSQSALDTASTDNQLNTFRGALNSDGTFVASSSGPDTLIRFDVNAAVGADNVLMQSIVLVGYVGTVNEGVVGDGLFLLM